jgi:hypothetical protein
MSFPLEKFDLCNACKNKVFQRVFGVQNRLFIKVFHSKNGFYERANL